MTFIAIAAALVVVAGAAFAALGLAVKSSYSKKQRLLADTDTAAPFEWVGSHAPEAKLHRRLVKALSGLRSSVGNDVSVSHNVDVLEREALRVEHQLVATADMADRLRPAALEKLAQAVTQIEDVAAQLIQRSAELSSADVDRQLAELSERLRLLDEARAELDDPHAQHRRVEETPDSSQLSIGESEPQEEV